MVGSLMDEEEVTPMQTGHTLYTLLDTCKVTAPESGRNELVYIQSVNKGHRVGRPQGKTTSQARERGTMPLSFTIFASDRLDS